MVGVLVIGITQFSFAEDSKTTSHITVDMGMLEQPTSKYDSQKITITGSMGDYIRGKNITIVIVNSYEEETEINSLSSKKGKIHAFFEITENSHVGGIK